MTDPLRTDHLPEAGEVPDRGRDARVERLLITGLDHYFAGQHELAISVWTRVLFLDRGHARAKAYIDRARSAMAERQREGEELLHTGAAAFDRGDARAARTLLNSAVESGAASEEALALLERLDRLEQASPHPARSIALLPSLETSADPSIATEKTGTARVVWVATGVIAGLAVAGVIAWIGLTRPDWLPVNSRTVAPPAAPVDEPLPVPAPSEVWLSRARALYEDGRLRDALGALDGIGRSDPLKADADELRATIQRTLLDAGRVRPAPSLRAPAGAARAPRRPQGSMPPSQ
jgi:tetratricopeptide (TPR) repeat protein